MTKKWFKLSNLLNGLFFAGVLVLIFNPSAKALMIQGMMKVGLFQPDIIKPVSKAAAKPGLPDVLFQSTDGRTIHLAEQKGKVVFINFWATWCPPCIAEMPSINGLYEKLKNNKNVVFIIVDADHNFQKSMPFMTKRKFTMPLYQLASGVPESLVSNSIPTTTIIDKNGQIVFHQAGSADYSNPKILEYLNRISK
ncbi:MAG: TlpA disulfide reductase family protein [Bacteroidota bacterium]